MLWIDVPALLLSKCCFVHRSSNILKMNFLPSFMHFTFIAHVWKYQISIDRLLNCRTASCMHSIEILCQAENGICSKCSIIIIPISSVRQNAAQGRLNLFDKLKTGSKWIECVTEFLFRRISFKTKAHSAHISITEKIVLFTHFLLFDLKFVKNDQKVFFP